MWPPWWNMATYTRVDQPLLISSSSAVPLNLWLREVFIGRDQLGDDELVGQAVVEFAGKVGQRAGIGGAVQELLKERIDPDAMILIAIEDDGRHIGRREPLGHQARKIAEGGRVDASAEPVAE